MDSGIDPGRKRSPALKIAAVIIVIVVLALLMVTPAAQSLIKNIVMSPYEKRYPEEATFSLERTLTVYANGGTVLNFTFDIPQPMNISQNGYQMQIVNNIDLTPSPTTLGSRYNQTWPVWEGGKLENSDKYTIVAKYDVTAKTHIWNIGKDQSLTVHDIPLSLKLQYLHDEWKIQVTDHSIVSLSKSIVGNETNVYTILNLIYTWMGNNIKYPTFSSNGEPQTATETLQSRVGDCDDQSILFCSLARAAGVPAWLQLGALFVDAESRWGGHGWLQTYIPLKSGGGEKVVIDIVNKDFLVWRPNRFVDYTDDGNAGHLTDYYYTFYSSYEQSSYLPGKMPVYSEDFRAISNVESEKKVSQGPVYDVDATDLILLGTAPRMTRR